MLCVKCQTHSNIRFQVKSGHTNIEDSVINRLALLIIVLMEMKEITFLILRVF